MRMQGTRLGLTLMLGLGLMAWPGCAGMSDGGGNGDSNDNNNTNDNGNDNTNGNDNSGGNGNDNSGGASTNFTATKTNIDVHNAGRIAVGDDILVYGFGGFAGVDYIVPSAGDTAGRGIPNGDNFVADAFVALGKKIVLTQNFLITVFDTESGTSTEIAEADVRLTNSPVGLYDQGTLKGSGMMVAIRNNSGSKVGVVDISGATPNVINFDVDVPSNVSEVDIDADTMQVVAVSGDSFYVYNINDPTAAPTVWDVSAAGGIGDSQIHLSDGYIFYEDNEAFGNARFIDVATGQVTTLTENPQAGTLNSDGGRFCTFVDRDANDSNGGDQRGAIGTIPGPGAMLSGDEQIDGSTTNNGFVGWSQVCTITPNGTYTFLSGSESIGSGEFLQVSTGGAFSLVNDPDGSSPYGLPATDVAVNGSLVGFKTGDGTTAGANTKVGYIILSGNDN